MAIKIKNGASDPVRFVPYRIDGLIVRNRDIPKIRPNECFRMGAGELDRLDTLDSLIVLVFLEDSRIPPSVGITQGVTGGGGGINIAGFGVSASVTVTVAFSQPIAAVRVGKSSRLTFKVTDSDKRLFDFVDAPADGDLDCENVRDF